MGKTSQYPTTEEIIFGSPLSKEANRIHNWLVTGKVRKIAPKIYTTNLHDQPEDIILRNWYKILAHQYPDGLLSHRSAFEYRPVNGYIFLTGSYKRRIELPGLIVQMMEGPSPLDNDPPFFNSLRVSSEARAFLENLQTARRTADAPVKTVTQEALENKLEAILRQRGETGLNRLRDEAKLIAQSLHMAGEYEKLNKLISGILATGESKYLKSELALARAKGMPIDADRVHLFDTLCDYLLRQDFASYPDHNAALPAAYRNFAFFEAYFSNYIEGTEFEVEEAKQIIFSKTPIPARDEDSHDILGTYAVVSSIEGMSKVPVDADQLLELLRQRHSILLSARTSKKPGKFKDKNNRAGNTEFVDHELVIGTLRKGFELHQQLQHPFAKAAYMMFMVSEVHPFLDGNGRIARVMMNAAMTHAKLSKIIIPTVFQEDYLGALKLFTKSRGPEAYVRMLYRAYQFSATIFGEDIDEMEQYLVGCDAFNTPKEDKLNFDVSRLRPI